MEAIAGAFPYATPYVYPMALTAQTASVYLTVAITVERYVAVCLPLKARSLCTHKRARWCVLAVFSFAVLYNFTRFFEYRHDTVYIWEYVSEFTVLLL